MLDAIVVGGGPAGLAAATWLARYRRRVVVLDSGEYRNRWADAAHGYLGRDPVHPAELLGRAREALCAYPTAEVRHQRAVKATGDGAGGFQVRTETGRLPARRLVLATGVRDQFPRIGGFLDHSGASVFHCPSCGGAGGGGPGAGRGPWRPAGPAAGGRRGGRLPAGLLLDRAPSGDWAG